MMLVLAAMMMSAGPVMDSPVVRLSGAEASFRATAVIRRGYAFGRGHKPPSHGAHQRVTQLTDSAGQPVPAIITDFE